MLITRSRISKRNLTPKIPSPPRTKAPNTRGCQSEEREKAEDAHREAERSAPKGNLEKKKQRKKRREGPERRPLTLPRRALHK